MRRRMLFLAAAAAVVVASGMFAAVAQAQTAGEDSVVGSGVGNVPQLPIPFDIDAHSGPSGENPTGTSRFVSEPFQIRLEGSVTCLRVSRNRAVIGMITATGTPVFIDVTDGTPDLIGLVFPVAPPAAPCPAPGIQPSAPPILSGDIVVTDAQPFPSSKDQCKNGGWRTYGVFRNQGHCVRFVRHQARQACGEERATIGRAAFRAKYGKGKHHRHAMRGCIRTRING